MKRLERHSLTVLAVLVAALAAALWLAGALEHGTLTWPSAGVPALPSLSPPGGSYAQSVALEMAPASRGGTVVFATGGHVPTVTVGTVYERPVLLDAGAPAVTVVRAREVVGGVAGPVVDASYAVGLGHTLPILSIIADPLDLWDPARGLLANTWQRGQAWERAVHVTYIDGDQVVALPAGLRVDGSEPFDAPKQSLRLYFRAEYGAARLAFPIFPDHPDQDDPSYKRLLLLAGDRSGRWTLLEEQLLSEVAAEVGGRVTQGRFVLLFLNGESWGIYRLGERIDRFYLEDNLGLRSADLIRGGDFEEGDAADWERLMAWLATHDVSDAANFATLAAQVDVDDFTDYAILQAYFGFPANRFSAVRPQGGGRWSWLYGDWQRAWTPDGSPETMLADDDPEDVAFLLHKLLENSGYRDDFARRAAALLNTTLAPEAMAARVERLAAALRPDIGYEEGRWSAPTAWERNVAALEALTGQRHAAVQAQVAAALGLEGMAQVAFAAVPEVGGRVFVDGLPVEQGAYFLGVDVTLAAVPAPGYRFDGWAGVAASTAGTTLTVMGPAAVEARFVPVGADDPAVCPNDVIFSEVWINDNGTRYASLEGRPIEGDWFELRVERAGGVDLRGWRVTDNDTKTGTDEGSIIFPQIDVLADVPQGTVILVIASQGNANAAYFGTDDLDPRDGRMVFYVGNGSLDVTADPGFGVGTGEDNLVLLAPGATAAFGDDVGVDFVAEGSAVTPYSFGVLADGVVFERPFRRLGQDDGAIFVGDVNDDGAAGWIVDPPADQTGDGDAFRGSNRLTPGARNR